MKILIFHQKFPMGNYLLNPKLAERLDAIDGIEAYSLEQLNGRKPDDAYIQQLLELDPDVVYFEMLDHETFKLVERLFKRPLKILCFASGGILEKYNDILDYYGIWYDKVMTNSKVFIDLFKTKDIKAEYFPYYFSVIDRDELKYDIEYNYDVVFLGMGFNRLVDEQYKQERDVFFETTIKGDYGIYGNGWDADGRKHPNYQGILPPDKIGDLYFNSTSAAAIIAGVQRQLGMINNRYTEIATSLCPIISIPYPDMDWHGLDKYITFVDNKAGFANAVKMWKVTKLEDDGDSYKKFCIEQANFMMKYDALFFEKLLHLIN